MIKESMGSWQKLKNNEVDGEDFDVDVVAGNQAKELVLAKKQSPEANSGCLHKHGYTLAWRSLRFGP